MAVKQILDMNDELEFPVEAILIKDWKNLELKKIGQVIPESDNVYYIAKEKGIVNWKTPKQFLNCTLTDGNLKSVVYISKKGFPSIMKRYTARGALKQAIQICNAQGWKTDRFHIECALSNLEMELE
ncbi:MAG: hypothetical protein K6A43_11905 [Treponema sp.]|nr:hypothetical protein [Treponema sp.]